MPRVAHRIPALALAALTLVACGASEREGANESPPPVRPTDVLTTEAPATPTVSSVDQDQAFCHKLYEASKTGDAHTAGSIIMNAETVLPGLQDPDLRRAMQGAADITDAVRAGNWDTETAQRIGFDLLVACADIADF